MLELQSWAGWTLGGIDLCQHNHASWTISNSEALSLSVILSYLNRQNNLKNRLPKVNISDAFSGNIFALNSYK